MESGQKDSRGREALFPPFQMLAGRKGQEFFNPRLLQSLRHLKLVPGPRTDREPLYE
jgi:hypothetical protein